MPLTRTLMALGLLLTLRAAAGDEYRAPLIAQPPTLDGKVEPVEWQRAVGFDGLSFNGQLEERRARAYIGATDTHIYVAVVSELPGEGGILARVDKDTPKLVYDDSIEVWVDAAPGEEDAGIFQALANPLGRITYIAHKRGDVPEKPNWRANYEIANGFHDGMWHCEVAVPLEQLTPGRTASEGRWGINVCRNWKQPWQFSSLGGAGYSPDEITFTFGRDPICVAYESDADPTTGEVHGRLVVRNFGPDEVSLPAELVLTRDVMPQAQARQTLAVGPGASANLELRLKDESTRKFTLSARVGSADGAITYYSRSYSWGKPREHRWTAVPPVVLPVDFKFAYYPYLDKMRILADWSGLKKDAQLEAVHFAVRQKGAQQALVSVDVEPGAQTRRELEFEMPPLEGEYEVAMTATGEGVPQGEVVKTFERTRYEWEHNDLGKSTKVYPPFTPIEIEGNAVRTVLREHTITGQGLWEQVTAAGQDLLAGPMTYEAVIEGTPAAADGFLSQPSLLTPDGNQAQGSARIGLGPLKALSQITWDYDGMMRVDLELSPTAGAVDSLDLVIPLKASQATHYHAMGDGIRNTLYTTVPAGEGTVWTSQKVNVNDFPAGFCSYIYVGTPNRGLCWFAENDRGWSWDRGKPNLELVRDEGRLSLRVHLINKPVTIAEPRRITFGLLAAPVKPRLAGWRTRWLDDRYTILGTDINWFALGNCGAVYPAHKDMYLWQMLAEGNRRRLDTEEIEKVVEYGRNYFEPYGEEYMERYARHVRYNLRSRYDKTMVLYYNRASYQKAGEFQTFMDEWSLEDYRAYSKGDGLGEIKIVPSESYIDHALYWYGKSFDVANNKGVYWDNLFFVADYNRTMTGAYMGADRAIMPSTGVWGLRELVKRTFQYMNERGMTPITMPHMTSTGILPLLSFATVQYDWEWRYSQGDFQDRFTRDYILLVTNGELAGTWPVLLGDHGKLATDPWTQRTFAGVSLVHELIGEGLPDVWRPLREPILELTRRPECKVARYWDDSPLPISTGDADLPAIVFWIPGQEAIVLVTSYSGADQTVTAKVDAAALGFTGGYVVGDVETGETLPVQDGALRFPLKQHDVRELRLTAQ